MKTKGQQVEATGTRMIIKAYKEDTIIKTTLIEGRMNVVTSHMVSPLKPGKQSLLTAGGIKIRNINPVSELAWTEGSFIFDRDNVEEMMNKISRWYGIDVSYARDNAEVSYEGVHYSGIISNSTDLKSLLGIIEAAGFLRFRREGKLIIVSAN